MKKILALVLALALCLSCASALAAKVGVSMPTKDLQRWNQDGENMEAQLKEAGFDVELQFASNDVQQQLAQVETMIDDGCEVLVIAAIEGSSLGSALEKAKEKGIPVIAYDRLLMDSDAVSYYATFDNYMVGTVQGTYVKEQLDLDNAEGPFVLEFTAGDPGDNNAGYFFNGAMDVLKPYIESGKIKALATLMSQPLPATPDIPTAQSSGLPHLTIDTLYGILAPKGTDAAIVEKLNAAILKIVNTNDEYKQAIRNYNFQEPYALNVKDTIERLKGQREHMMSYSKYLQ